MLLAMLPRDCPGGACFLSLFPLLAGLDHLPNIGGLDSLEFVLSEGLEFNDTLRLSLGPFEEGDELLFGSLFAEAFRERGEDEGSLLFWFGEF